MDTLAHREDDRILGGSSSSSAGTFANFALVPLPWPKLSRRITEQTWLHCKRDPTQGAKQEMVCGMSQAVLLIDRLYPGSRSSKSHEINSSFRARTVTIAQQTNRNSTVPARVGGEEKEWPLQRHLHLQRNLQSHCYGHSRPSSSNYEATDKKQSTAASQ